MPIVVLLLSWTLAGPAPAAASGPSLDEASTAAVVAAVRARMGETAEVEVSAIGVDAPKVTPREAVLDPTAAIAAPSRVVFRAATGAPAPMRPVGAATVSLQVTVDHWHAGAAIARGGTIGERDIVRARHALPRGPLRPLPQADAVIGARALRDLAAGACLTSAVLTPQPLIRQGAEVTGVIRVDGLEARAQLVALDSGRAGARIRVMNPESRRTFRARIVSRDLVEIQP